MAIFVFCIKIVFVYKSTDLNTNYLFFKRTHPKVWIVSKYDIWPGSLLAAHWAHVPVLLCSAELAKDSVRYAEFDVKRIRKRTEILKSFLFAGKVTKEIGNENIRELIERNYRIIYRIINKQRVDILTIHHSARDLTTRKIL